MLCYFDPNRDVKIHDVAVKKRTQTVEGHLQGCDV